MPRRTLKHAKRPVVVVGKIHAKWCGHCAALVHEWDTMKASLKRTHPHIVVEAVEQSNEVVGLNRINRLYRKGAVKPVALQGGYPTIFKIVKGKLSYYSGDRTSAELVKWVTHGLHGGNDFSETGQQGLDGEQGLDGTIGGEEQILDKSLLGGKRKTQRKRSNRRRKTCRKCHNLFSFW